MAGKRENCLKTARITVVNRTERYFQMWEVVKGLK